MFRIDGKSRSDHRRFTAARSTGAVLKRRKILFVGGSLNQTTMMHAVARHLPEHDCAFSPFYGDGLVRALADAGLLGFTILGGRPRRRSEEYLRRHRLALDYRGAAGDYDLVVMSTDLIVPKNVRGRRIVLVQEGMTDPEDWRYRLVRTLRLPRYLANTSMTGLSHAYDRFCVASDGYRELFVQKGVRPERIEVTGMPNFDDARAALANDFPHRGYVLAATSCLRETFKRDDRPAFIRRVLAIAAGRQVIFKLHPNERTGRARREIERLAPQALVYADGNTDHMIANCDVLVTRYSSVVYVALALGKEVHADVEVARLRRLAPVQNGGTSGRRIAEVCREYLQ
jgi:hypothetical protein